MTPVKPGPYIALPQRPLQPRLAQQTMMAGAVALVMTSTSDPSWLTYLACVRDALPEAEDCSLLMIDQLHFAMRAMDMVHDDAAALHAARDFLSKSAVDAMAAGQALQSFIITWSQGQQDPGHAERILAAMPDHPADRQATETTAFEHERKLQ